MRIIIQGKTGLDHPKITKKQREDKRARVKKQVRAKLDIKPDINVKVIFPGEEGY